MQEKQRFWMVTASADHAARGRAEGIVQACHGKVAPLRRMRPGDGVVIYSPRTGMRDGVPVMAFTALGRVADAAAWQHDMGGGFVPWRRAVAWYGTGAAPIRPLLDRLELTAGQSGWGMAFRYGHREISAHDFRLIEAEMTAQPAHGQAP
jgi:hypothetical protein